MKLGSALNGSHADVRRTIQAARAAGRPRGLHSLGLILHEMFRGKRAFEGPRDAVTAPSLNSLVSDVDPTVERVILRSLYEGPGSRPPSALAIAVVDSRCLTRQSETAWRQFQGAIWTAGSIPPVTRRSRQLGHPPC